MEDSKDKIKEQAPAPQVVNAAEEPARAEWGNHCEFFLSSLGLAVGLGNIWRFPYVCYSNGGGTFLLPYLLMLLIVGLPLFFMEMALGQYAGLSAPKIYARLAPGLKGMGYGMVTIPTVINFYYTVVMAYAFYFLFMGFTSTLPWGVCSNDYNSENCYSFIEADECNSTALFFNKTCMPTEIFCDDHGFDSLEGNNTHCFDLSWNGTAKAVKDIEQRVSGAEEFWYRQVLDVQVKYTEDGTVIDTEINSWSQWGSVNWKIAGCLLLCWTIVCLSLIKGVQSYGKVVYFTTLFPYIVLTTLLIYASTLPGFTTGLEFYLVPDWSKLGNLSLWNAAASQIFYSLGVSQGSQLLLSSYNGFKTNCHRDALLIGLCNSLTSIYAGLVVFGVVGFIAYKKEALVSEVVEAGPGLAFIVYPEAVSAMAAAPFFSFMFFFMLCLLAISSVCGSWEPLIASITDEFPSLRKKRVLVMIGSCTIAFLAGFPICFQSGVLLFQLMDARTANSVVLMSFLQLVTLSWFYGLDRFFVHIEEMGMKLPGFLKVYWRTCWTIITPFMIAFVTIYAWAYKEADFYLGYEYPPAVQFLGWCFELLALSVLIIYGLIVIIKRCRKGDPVAFLKPGPMMLPKDTWGPRPDSGLPTTAPVVAVDNPTFQIDES